MQRRRLQLLLSAVMLRMGRTLTHQHQLPRRSLLPLELRLRASPRLLLHLQRQPQQLLWVRKHHRRWFLLSLWRRRRQLKTVPAKQTVVRKLALLLRLPTTRRTRAPMTPLHHLLLLQVLLHPPLAPACLGRLTLPAQCPPLPPQLPHHDPKLQRRLRLLLQRPLHPRLFLHRPLQQR